MGMSLAIVDEAEFKCLPFQITGDGSVSGEVIVNNTLELSFRTESDISFKSFLSYDIIVPSKIIPSFCQIHFTNIICHIYSHVVKCMCM